MQLSLGGLGHDREVLYRRVSGRKDYCGERNHFASVTALLAPDRFAEQLRRDLRLSPAVHTPERLFA